MPPSELKAHSILAVTPGAARNHAAPGDALVHRPLVGRPIVAPLAAAVLELQRHLGGVARCRARDAQRTQRARQGRVETVALRRTWYAPGPVVSARPTAGGTPLRRPTYTCPNPPLPSLRSTQYVGEFPTCACAGRVSASRHRALHTARAPREAARQAAATRVAHRLAPRSCTSESPETRQRTRSGTGASFASSPSAAAASTFSWLRSSEASSLAISHRRRRRRASAGFKRRARKPAATACRRKCRAAQQHARSAVRAPA